MLETKLRDVAQPSFARHETFAPRFGWLHKAYTALSDGALGSEVFLRDDATVALGVGKNMVHAIRFWSQAFKITVEYPKGGNSRALAAGVTWEGRWLLDEDGADPYLEDAGSLWLLHWWLLAPPCFVPSWWVAFNAMSSSRFTQSGLNETIVRNIRMAEWTLPAAASIGKDTDCITKMYARRRTPDGSRESFEDLLDCPFRELGLLESVDSERKGDRTADRIWQFTSSGRTSLPARIVAYACLDYAAKDESLSGGGSIALARLANEPGGPGRAFRLREPEIAAALDLVAAEHQGLAITEGVGQRSLTFASNPFDLAWDVLDQHYGKVRQRPGFPDRDSWYAHHPELAQEMRARKHGRHQQQVSLTGDIA